MSEQNQTSGQTQDPADQEQNSTQEQKNVVAYENHLKLLNEKKKQGEELKKAREDLAKVAQERKELEERSLKEKEDYKKLFESRDVELQSERQARLAIENQVNESKKLNAFLKSVGHPIDQRYWNLIDLDKIALDPETGKPDEMTAKSYADEFRKSYWEILTPQQNRMPNDGPSNKQNGLSYEQWLKLPLVEQRKRMNDII